MNLSRMSPKTLLLMAVIGAVMYFGFGINPISLLNGGSGANYVPSSQQSSTGKLQNNDEEALFISTILADTEEIWHSIFQKNGMQYEEPMLTLFSGGVRSACGQASAATGPFYCPADKNIYIDLNFYKELKNRFEAPGDFAQAYVLAHEAGHHVQNLIGVLSEYHSKRQTLSKKQANALSVRVELQADCFAGIWGYYSQKKQYLEQGDLEEALNAATQIGDDAIQRRVQGYVVPDSFNHGSSEQRVRWFKKGFDNGDLASCDSFSNKNL